MNKIQKVLAASTLGTLLAGGFASHAFAHAATPSKSSTDPFHTPDFNLYKAIDYFSAIEKMSSTHNASYSLNDLEHIIQNAPLAEHDKTTLLHVKNAMLGNLYQADEPLSARDITQFTDYAEGYILLTSHGFENIIYSSGLVVEQPQKPVNRSAAPILEDTADGVCSPSDEPAAKNAKERLENFKERIDPVPDTEATLKFLKEKNITTKFAKLDKSLGGQYYAGSSSYKRGAWYYASKTLEMNNQYPDEKIVDIFFHEKRHAEQMEDKVIHPPGRVSAADMAWQVRVIEADAQSSTVIAMLKLKLDGDSSCFDRGMQMSSPYFNMYRAADRMYAEDPASLDDGRLQRAVFDAWFYTGYGSIKNAYDKDAIEKQWPPMDRSFNGIFVAQTPLDPAFVKKVGNVGEAKVNYLDLPNTLPMNDPYYKEGFSFDNQEKLDKLDNNYWVVKKGEKSLTIDPKQPEARRRAFARNRLELEP